MRGSALALIIVLIGFALGRLATLRTDCPCCAPQRGLRAQASFFFFFGFFFFFFCQRSATSEGMHLFTDATRHHRLATRRPRFFACNLPSLRGWLTDANSIFDRARKPVAQRRPPTIARNFWQLEQRLVELRTTLEQRPIVANENQKTDEMQRPSTRVAGHARRRPAKRSARLRSARSGAKGGDFNARAGVCDLKRVLSNLKSRARGGRATRSVLATFLVRAYGIPRRDDSGTNRRVEFAIRIRQVHRAAVLDSVDSKFPVEHGRLQGALDRADADAAILRANFSAQFARTQAKKVRETYCADAHERFAFCLDYASCTRAHVTRGLFDELQPSIADMRASNFVRLERRADGFQRVAIDQRSAELQCGSVLTEFGTWPDALARAEEARGANTCATRAANATTSGSYAASKRFPTFRRCDCFLTDLSARSYEPPLDEK